MRRGQVGLVLLWALVGGCASDEDGEGDGCGDGVCARDESNATCSLDCAANGPRCGDGTCNGTETAGSCASDCGSTACTTAPDNCTGETLCVAGTCVAAFPRVYSITSVVVAVPTTNPTNGEDWDAGGGAPDMFLGDSTGVPFTAVVQDQFNASFAGPYDVQLIAGSTLRIDVWDEDLTVDDLVLSCSASPITAQQLRSRAFSCAGNGRSMTSAINPK